MMHLNLILDYAMLGLMFFSFQIYVEIERARLSRILAKIREDEGNIIEAASVLQELQVLSYDLLCCNMFVPIHLFFNHFEPGILLFLSIFSTSQTELIKLAPDEDRQT
jgi:hypothetical protein